MGKGSNQKWYSMSAAALHAAGCSMGHRRGVRYRSVRKALYHPHTCTQHRTLGPVHVQTYGNSHGWFRSLSIIPEPAAERWQHSRQRRQLRTA